jgi:PEP-CTERM motif
MDFPMKITWTLLINFLSVAFCSIVFCATSAEASMQTYGFYNISANNVNDSAAGEAQLSVTVSDEGLGANQVAFIFSNVGATAMSICDVYFDDGSLLGIVSLIGGVGDDVAFSEGAKPGSLPSGSNVDWNGEGTSGNHFTADSDAGSGGVMTHGVNPGETLTIIFDLIAGQTYADVIDAIALAGTDPGVDVHAALRIGIHVQGFANNGSEAFVNNPDEHVAPEPASIALFSLGVLGMGALTRRRRQRDNSNCMNHQMHNLC